MTTHMGIVMTLANSIIGVSLLAMPYCFKQCGLLLAVLLLVASGTTTRLACHLLVKSGVMSRRKNLEFVAYHAFGVSGKLLVELGVIGFLLGTCVAYFVVMGDLAPTILAKLFKIDNDYSLRTSVLLVVAVFIVLPLSMLRNIESLAAISMITMMFYLLLVFKILSESFPHLAVADWPEKVHYWRPEGVLQCFPIFAMALACQTQVFEILEVLPNPTLERMNNVVRSAVNLCTGLYVSVGFLGYVAYARESFGGNILLSFSPSTSSDLFQLGFVVSIALSFPIVVFPCRASLNSLLFKKGTHYQELSTQSTYIPDSRFKLLTCGIVGTAFVTGLLAPNIELVLGFVGSTIGVATCVVFPAAAFINISNKETNERVLAKIMVVLGLAVMLLGIFGNLDAVADRKYEPPVKEKLFLHSPLPPIQQIEVPKFIAIDKSLIESKEKEPALPKEEKKELRLEPPIPVEPILLPKKPKPDNPIDKKDELPNKPSVPSVIVTAVPKVINVIKEESEKKVEKVVIPESLKANIEPKKGDTVHADAIAKEELELKEDDSVLKKEETQELLKKLEEHKEEQKQLLKEQQNILDEIKIRDGEPKTIKEVEPIHPKQFNDNIDKIQEVIDDLKEKKIVIDRNKGIKIAEEKERNAKKKVVLQGIAEPNKTLVFENKPGSMPVLLKAIQPSNSSLNLGATAKLNNNVVVGRDILEEKTSPSHEREKRDAHDDGSCVKNTRSNDINDRHNDIKDSDNNINDSKDRNNNIKMSEVLSPPLNDAQVSLPNLDTIDILKQINVANSFQAQEKPLKKKKK